MKLEIFVAFAVADEETINISPVERSIIVSVPAFTLKVSFPAPPVNESFPLSPKILSSLVPAIILSFSFPPFILEEILGPFIFSAPVDPFMVIVSKLLSKLVADNPAKIIFSEGDILIIMLDVPSAVSDKLINSEVNWLPLNVPVLLIPVNLISSISFKLSSDKFEKLVSSIISIVSVPSLLNSIIFSPVPTSDVPENL